MNRDELIGALVADLTPVRRLPGAGARAGLWAGLAIAWVGLCAAALGTRPDLASKLREIGFLAENAVLAGVFAAAARWVFQLALPGAAPSVPVQLAPALGFAAWVVALAARAAAAGPGAIAWTAGLPCAARVAGLSLAPAAALFVMLRRATPAARGWSGLLALASPGALAVIGTQLVCAKDAPGHILVWHAGPLVAVALVGIVAGGAWLGPRGPIARIA
ncbi:MAG TPA: NrsF family protein [Kofleriaceae bacterium]|nr:NrsF family protein [Kofleriaceae bacterium]